jgi:hypothetical protein
MDWNQIEGSWKQTSGRIKEKWGKSPSFFAERHQERFIPASVRSRCARRHSHYAAPKERRKLRCRHRAESAVAADGHLFRCSLQRWLRLWLVWRRRWGVGQPIALKKIRTIEQSAVATIASRVIVLRTSPSRPRELDQQTIRNALRSSSARFDIHTSKPLFDARNGLAILGFS